MPQQIANSVEEFEKKAYGNYRAFRPGFAAGLGWTLFAFALTDALLNVRGSGGPSVLGLQYYLTIEGPKVSADKWSIDAFGVQLGLLLLSSLLLYRSPWRQWAIANTGQFANCVPSFMPRKGR